MHQPDLFSAMDAAPDATPETAPAVAPDLDLPALLDRLTDVSARPRYTFMVLNLIARAAGPSDSLGPYVRERGEFIPVRDWLSDAMVPVARRDARRRAILDKVRDDLRGRGAMPDDPALAEQLVAREMRDRLRQSGRTNVSRAVSDLVRAGFLRRHYQGYRVDHDNRGAGREAVYTITPAVKRALGKMN
ncbi:MAG: hypothetical protein KGJ57_15870 [Sphingomonadales bacterium]|nr:hypothetical protein [Sphingomonadales bacterium]MDE2170881.1 hypothetical protein [Sphingomonadales bacterium]